MISLCITTPIRKMWWLMHSTRSLEECWLVWFPGSGRCSRLWDSSGCTTGVGFKVLWGSGYAFPTEQSDRVLRTRHEDIFHQGPGTVGSCGEGWAIHTYDSLWYRGRVMVPQSANLREEILKSFIAPVLLCTQVARRCIMIFVASITRAG